MTSADVNFVAGPVNAALGEDEGVQVFAPGRSSTPSMSNREKFEHAGRRAHRE